MRQGEASSTQRKHSGGEMYLNHCFKSLSKRLRDIMLIKEMSEADERCYSQ